VEVKIGVQNVAREITVETHQTAAEVSSLVSEAVSAGTLLQLVDDKGRTVMVPGSIIGYVEVGAEGERRVGFGTS
jgi:hypothetical protein